MFAATQTGESLPAVSSDPSILGIWLREARIEFLRLLRAPAFYVPTIAFPLMFYVLFGVLLGPGHAHQETAREVLAAFLVFGTMAPGLFALGITVALDRERGLLELKRALPMPAGAYVFAKLAMSLVFAAIVATLLLLVAATAGGVVLEPGQWGLLLLVAVLGVLPFCAVGLLVGAWTKAAATPAVLNLIYLPMSLLSGLWVPLQHLPRVIGRLAPLWPAWQLAQVARTVVGVSDAGAASHLVALAAVAAVCALIARRRLARAR
jgi:ABC-2 type transport system permease protein